ncbi:MAG: hypothetical protein WKF43_15705 [Acidimicrobiales bacterium]
MPGSAAGQPRIDRAIRRSAFARALRKVSGDAIAELRSKITSRRVNRRWLRWPGRPPSSAPRSTRGLRTQTS